MLAEYLMPADYYRRHATRVKQLAGAASTPAVRDELVDVALQYERLAENAEAAQRSRALAA